MQDVDTQRDLAISEATLLYQRALARVPLARRKSLVDAATALLSPYDMTTADLRMTPPHADVALTAPAVITAMIDETGSMRARVAETISGYNEFIRSLRESLQGHPARLSAYKFDRHASEPTVRPHQVDVPIERASPLSTHNYHPRGQTPLWDAVWELIRVTDTMALRHGADRVTMIIHTDGEENASQAHSLEEVRGMITERQSRGWQVVFLGANLDTAYEVSRRMNVNRVNTVNFASGMERQGFGAVGQSVGTYSNAMAASAAMPDSARVKMGDKTKTGT